jgi:hypothetical protein
MSSRSKEVPLEAIEELERSIAQLKAVAEMMFAVAYHGYSSGTGGVVEIPGGKHNMVRGGLSIKDARVHKELQRLKADVEIQKQAVKVLTGKYYRVVFDRAPGEPVTDEWLEYLEEWEKRRRR